MGQFCAQPVLKRFDFHLTVAKTMAIGRTFRESFQKALRGLEVGSFGFGCDGMDLWETDEQPSRNDPDRKRI